MKAIAPSFFLCQPTDIRISWVLRRYHSAVQLSPTTPLKSRGRDGNLCFVTFCHSDALHFVSASLLAKSSPTPFTHLSTCVHSLHTYTVA